MKYLNLTVFLFCIHIAAAMVNLLAVFDVTLFQPNRQWMDAVGTDSLKADQYTANQVAEASDFGWSELWQITKGFFYFAAAVGLGPIMLVWTLYQWGVGWEMCTLIAAPLSLLYLIGIMQWISNRGAEGMK